MTSHQTKIRIARSGTLPDEAGEYLYKHGPLLEHDLFFALGGASPKPQQAHALQCAITGGWLSITADGKVDCSVTARAHYAELAGKTVVKTLGEVAAVREVRNVYERPPLSKKYIPNSRGMREDVPDWSVRASGFGLKSATGNIREFSR